MLSIRHLILNSTLTNISNWLACWSGHFTMQMYKDVTIGTFIFWIVSVSSIGYGYLSLQYRRVFFLVGEWWFVSFECLAATLDSQKMWKVGTRERGWGRGREGKKPPRLPSLTYLPDAHSLVRWFGLALSARTPKLRLHCRLGWTPSKSQQKYVLKEIWAAKS